MRTTNAERSMRLLGRVLATEEPDIAYNDARKRALKAAREWGAMQSERREVVEHVSTLAAAFLNGLEEERGNIIGLEGACDA